MNDEIKLERIATSLKVKDLNCSAYSAIEDLKELLANNPTLAKDAYKQIIPVLKTDGDKWFSISGVAIRALNKVLDCDQSLAKDIYEQIIPFLHYCSNDATASAICILTDIVIYDRSFANEELLEKMESFVTDDDIDITGSANYLAGLIKGIIITKR